MPFLEFRGPGNWETGGPPEESLRKVVSTGCQFASSSHPCFRDYLEAAYPYPLWGIKMFGDWGKSKGVSVLVGGATIQRRRFRTPEILVRKKPRQKMLQDRINRN